MSKVEELEKENANLKEIIEKLKEQHKVDCDKHFHEGIQQGYILGYEKGHYEGCAVLRFEESDYE